MQDQQKQKNKKGKKEKKGRKECSPQRNGKKTMTSFSIKATIFGPETEEESTKEERRGRRNPIQNQTER